MRILYSSKASTIAIDAEIMGVLESVSESFLRDVVQTLSFPRHFVAESRNNWLAAERIIAQLQSYGYHAFYQGKYANVVALPFPGKKFPSWEGLGVGKRSQRVVADEPTPHPSQEGNPRNSVILIGAHYDSVPGTPGADDNASAVAALLGCAKAVAEYAQNIPVCFVSFNREEDNLIGSADFVKTYLPASDLQIRQAHILEMVGYCSHSPHSQRKPLGLPVTIPKQGNFLGLIGNKHSNSLIDSLLRQAKSYLRDFPVVGLKIYFGLENFFYHLLRSDHTPFWRRKLPALMWTDTANFRNPNYHRVTDTPDTLDYGFLRRVTQLLVLQVLTSFKT
jgi:hypothetical protein